MIAEKNQDDSITMRLSEGEVYILKNALNEVCNGIDVPEFQTRMGVERDEVEALLGQMSSFLRNLRAK